MALFDKYARLRKAMGPGSVHSDREKILDYLEGRVTKQELPVLVVEPATVAGVQACVRFASEKGLEVVVCSGLAPRTVEDLAGKMMLSTARLTGAPSFLDENTRLQIAAGVSLEALQVDLDRHDVRWPPLFPMPKATSVGAVIAAGWQGIRTWRHGGTLTHVAGAEWVDGGGELRAAGTLAGATDQADMLSCLFGSRGEFGILTRVELLLEPNPGVRTACTIHLTEASEIVGVLSQIGLSSSPPDVIFLLDSGALEILRRGLEAAIPEETRAMVICEWGGTPPDSLASPAPVRWFEDSEATDRLWTELFALVPAAARFYPARLEGQVVLPARSFAGLEAHARELSYEANIAVALLGTVEVGHLHIWLLLSEDDPRIRRQAAQVLDKLQEYAAESGGGPAGRIAARARRRWTRYHGVSATSAQVRDKLKKLLDPHRIFRAEETA